MVNEFTLSSPNTSKVLYKDFSSIHIIDGQLKGNITVTVLPSYLKEPSQSESAKELELISKKRSKRFAKVSKNLEFIQEYITYNATVTNWIPQKIEKLYPTWQQQTRKPKDFEKILENIDSSKRIFEDLQRKFANEIFKASSIIPDFRKHAASIDKKAKSLNEGGQLWELEIALRKAQITQDQIAGHYSKAANILETFMDKRDALTKLLMGIDVQKNSEIISLKIICYQ